MSKERKRILTIILVFALTIPMLLAGVMNIHADDEKHIWCSNTECQHNYAWINNRIVQVAGTWKPNESGGSLSASDKSWLQSVCDKLNADGATGLSSSMASDFGITITSSDSSCPACGTAFNYDSATEGTAAESTGKKGMAQNFFESVILEQVLNMNAGEESGSLSTVTLLNRTFVYAIAIMEGADSAPTGYLGEEGLGSALAGYDGITHETWYLFLEVAAILIMFIRFASDYSMDKVWQPVERNTPEQMMKPVIRLVVGFIFILLAHHLLAFGLVLSQAAFSAISQSTTSAETLSLYQDMSKNICDLLGFVPEKGPIDFMKNLGALISGVIEFFLPFLISGISALGIMFVVFSRVLELVVRAVFAPLAMTDCYKSGEHTHGFHYIMEFFGIAFQSLAIFAVLWVSGMVCGMFTAELKTTMASATGVGADLNRASQMALYISALKLAQLTMLLKTASITKSVFA